MLMRVSEFQEQFSEASRPTSETVRGWIASGTIWGIKLGRCWYVDLDRAPEADMQAPAPDSGLSERARRVLNS